MEQLPISRDDNEELVRDEHTTDIEEADEALEAAAAEERNHLHLTPGMLRTLRRRTDGEDI